MDSHGVMELVAFLEERYGIAVGDEDLTPENFESVTRIDEFVTAQAERAGLARRPAMIRTEARPC